MGRGVTQFSHAAGTSLRSDRLWPRAAILDCDGLLVDTVSCWHAAYRSAAAAVGCSLDGVDLGFLEGASVPVAAERLTQVLGRPIARALVGDALRHAVTTRPICAMPGSEKLLTALADQVPLAVASNAPASTVQVALMRSALDGFLSVIVSAETTGVFKPEPEVYLRACGQLNVDPSDAIAFEDSAVGACAARAAGLTVVVVPSGPAARKHADLAVPRLNDPRVVELFGLHGRGAQSDTGRSLTRS